MTNKLKLKVLVIGATGMLGSTIFRAFSAFSDLQTYGTIRNVIGRKYFAPALRNALIPSINMESESGLLTAFSIARPDVVINCVGIIKQSPIANDYLESLSINATLPHRLAKYCEMSGARLIHFSTDCVFSGKSGLYVEGDFPDANDLYGRTKFLGEVDYGNTLTLRTSIIGHELASKKSLVDWFLSQELQVKGFRRAIFSGLPTIEIARLLKEHIITDSSLKGMYHLSVNPIDKNYLLNLISEVYGKKILIVPDDNLIIDRSLNSNRFRLATGFIPKSWPQLISDMYHDNLVAQQSQPELAP
jgi:dTDP-4-dehydrorhamnose reductase